MAEHSETYQHKLRADSPRQIVGMVACFIFANIAKDQGWVPYVPAFALAFTVFYLIDYWIPPRPPVSFVTWFVKVILLIGYVTTGMWVIPKWLSHWLWAPLAYGVPGFLVMMSIRWLPPLYPIKRADSLRKTLLWSVVFALVFALLGWYSPGNI